MASLSLCFLQLYLQDCSQNSRVHPKPLLQGGSPTTSGHCCSSLTNPHPICQMLLHPIFRGPESWEFGNHFTPAREENVSLFHGRREKEREQSGVGLPLHPGVKGVFTKMICFRLPRAGPVEKVPPGRTDAQGALFPRYSCAVWPSCPHPPCKRQIPAQPPQQE